MHLYIIRKPIDLLRFSTQVQLFYQSPDTCTKIGDQNTSGHCIGQEGDNNFLGVAVDSLVYGMFTQWMHVVQLLPIQLLVNSQSD